MTSDLYSLLEVSKTATAEELKKAFRRLARAHHPDLNPDDPASEARFRQIQEAYAILSEPDTRALYDRLGPAYFERPGMGAGFKTPKAMLETLLAGLFKQEQPHKKRGEDLRYHLPLALEELTLHQERVLEIPREQDCLRCRATGADGHEGKQPCPRCEGLGELQAGQGLFAFKRPCLSCRGTGYRIVKPCPDCKGRGRSRFLDAVKVRIPQGVETGQRLRVRERGNQGYQGGEPGDLFVIIHLKPHPQFKRQGAELICELTLDAAQALMGGTFPIPTLNGSVQITLPPRVEHGRLYRLKGLGLPRNGVHGRGDLHVRVVIPPPDGPPLLERLKRRAMDGRGPQSSKGAGAEQEPERSPDGSS